MRRSSQHAAVRKVLLSPKLEGKAGRAHLAGILDYLDAGHVWDVRIVRSASELTREAVRQALADGVEGFLVSMASPSHHKSVINLLARSGRAVVVLDNHEPQSSPSGFAYVRFDTSAIVASGLDYFEKILPGSPVAFVPDPSREPWSTARADAFAALAAKRGMDARLFSGRTRAALAKWLAELPVPSGVLAANDLTALQIVEICAETGINVPNQLAVLGIDNDELICGHTRPPIATIEPNFAGAGFLAASTLQRLMEGRATPREVIVSESVTRIVARESARPAARTPHLVRRAMELIRADATRLDVGSVARALGVSRTRLAEAFRKEGTTVAGQIREVRFARVLELLADPHQAIGPIANFCGWKSETHLMHFFRRREGMTMSAWRRLHLKGR